MWKVLIIVCLQVQCRAEGRGINTFAGPYVGYAEMFYNCAGCFDWMWNLKVSHFNPMRPSELQRVTGWLNGTKHAFTDSGWMKVIMDVRSNNMWKENAFILNFPSKGCSSLRMFLPDFSHRVLRLNLTGHCVIIPNSYEARGVPVSWAVPSAPIMPYGKYRMRVRTGIEGVPSPKGCLIAEVAIIPKTS